MTSVTVCGNVYSIETTKLSLSGRNLSSLYRPQPYENEFDFENNDFIKLIRLEFLRITQYTITHLPISVCNLKFLKKLYLPSNHMETLPENIGDLINLQSIVLSDNKIRRLPDSICKLKNLMSLDVRRNLLKKLPDSIGDLEELMILDITQNEILSLPHSMEKMKKIQTIYHDSNILCIEE